MPVSFATARGPARPRHGRAALLGAALATALAAPGAASAADATLSYTATFSGAGGDLTYGHGDTSVVTLVQGFLPLFDTALGTLERVTVDFSGWRSFDFTCTQGAVGTPGGCNAGVNGRFVLDSVNYPVWSFVNIADINPRTFAQVGLAPLPGTSQSATAYGEASTTVEVTDPLTLQRHFTNATGNAPFVDYRMYFQALDGGASGQGGAAAITAFYFNGDAELNLRYHYASAVPEPGALALWMAGLGAVAGVVRRRTRRG